MNDGSTKGDDAFRYIALGDSLTAGMGDLAGYDGRHAGWAQRMAWSLEGLTGRKVKFSNLAVGGSTLYEVIEYQLMPALSRQPDMASLTVGINDIGYEGFDAEDFGSLLGKVMDAFTEHGVRLLTCTYPDMSPFTDLPRQWRLLMMREIRNINRAIAKQAADHGAMLLDLQGWHGAEVLEMLSDDWFHPSKEGHLLLGSLFADLVLREAGMFII